MVGERPCPGLVEQSATAAAPQSPRREQAMTKDGPVSIASTDTVGSGALGDGSNPMVYAASGGRCTPAGYKHFSIVLGGGPPHLILAGELDICSLPELTAALADAADGVGTLHLDLTDVRFCDLAALRAILDLTGTSDHQPHPARPVVLHHPPALMRRILQLTGWDTLPSVTIDTTEIAP
jgi:ABC-type transporter Mla MlaB component